jgi:hypothetical protein
MDSVKKSPEKTRKRKVQPVARELMVVELQPMDMVALRSHISNLVCAHAAAMVSATIQQVDHGHYQGMKYLFEMIGLFPATAMPEATQEDSLAGMLLSRLGIQDETVAESQQGNHVK